MRELDRKELDRFIAGKERPVVVMFYTPLCGTCKLAMRMLDIAGTLLRELPMAACNVNFIPEQVQSWQIASVPCIGIFQHHTLIRKIYRMQSVDELYGTLKAYDKSH